MLTPTAPEMVACWTVSRDYYLIAVGCRELPDCLTLSMRTRGNKATGWNFGQSEAEVSAQGLESVIFCQIPYLPLFHQLLFRSLQRPSDRYSCLLCLCQRRISGPLKPVRKTKNGGPRVSTSSTLVGTTFGHDCERDGLLRGIPLARVHCTLRTAMF